MAIHKIIDIVIMESSTINSTVKILYCFIGTGTVTVPFILKGIHH